MQATLKGIDKGDIVSSGLPQVSKEGSTGISSGDLGVSRQPRLGALSILQSSVLYVGC